MTPDKQTIGLQSMPTSNPVDNCVFINCLSKLDVHLGSDGALLSMYNG